jgi:hypothetical protein
MYIVLAACSCGIVSPLEHVGREIQSSLCIGLNDSFKWFALIGPEFHSFRLRKQVVE